MIRVVVPDSHGSSIDKQAARAFLDDLRILDPRELVFLGDHVDVSGIFSAHAPNYIDDLEYSYEEDCKAANWFLDEIQKAAPRATGYYLEGNHEQHVERWLSRIYRVRSDALGARSALEPAARLDLKRRGIRYFRSGGAHMGLSVPGTIKLGKCMFSHGSRVGKHATSAHLDDFGGNIVHGHTHRSQAVVRRTVAAGEIGAWCPGTLAQLQPLYLHNGLSGWTHGYGLQMVERDGRFLHINVPIARGKSLLRPLLDALRPQKLFGDKKAA